MEEAEREDWGVLPTDDRKTALKKAIEATWLERWIEPLRDHTFPTVVLAPGEPCPDVLPCWKILDQSCACTPPCRSMVRMTNRSPKDSPHWGPSTSRADVERLFETSLRCKRGASGQLVFRQWCPDMVEEARVFWNRRVVAISFASSFPFDVEALIDVVHALPLPYWRCVLDVAKMKDGSWKLVEINSWAVNSGGMRFDWKEDNAIFHPDEEDPTVVLRSTEGERRVHSHRGLERGSQLLDPLEVFPLAPTGPSCYLLSERHLYVANDVFLGRFDRATLRPLNWVEGDFRFSSIVVLSESPLQFSLGGEAFHHDLTRLPGRRTPFGPPCPGLWWYGFRAQGKGGKEVFCRLMHSGRFVVIEP